MKFAGASPSRFDSSPSPAPSAPWQVAQFSWKSVAPRAADGAAGGSACGATPVSADHARGERATSRLERVLRRRAVRDRSFDLPRRPRRSRAAARDRAPRRGAAPPPRARSDGRARPASSNGLAVLACIPRSRLEEPRAASHLARGVAAARPPAATRAAPERRAATGEAATTTSKLKVDFNYNRRPPPHVKRRPAGGSRPARNPRRRRLRSRDGRVLAALPAVRADAVELHPVAAHDEAQEAGDPLLLALELLAVELDDLAAALADDVVVVLRRLLGRLVARLPVVEVALRRRGRTPSAA